MKKALKATSLCLVTAFTTFASPAFASTRFEVSNGKLIDHSTNLMWSKPSSSIAIGLPGLGELVDGRRVATYEELSKVLPGKWTGPTNPKLIDVPTENKDLGIAMNFFSQALTAYPGWSGLECGVASASYTCKSIEGFVSLKGIGDEVFYEDWFGQVKTLKDRSVTMSMVSTGTVGSYTKAHCGSFCGENQFFTVQTSPVPEPTTLALNLAGLGMLALFLCRASTSSVRRTA